MGVLARPRENVHEQSMLYRSNFKKGNLAKPARMPGQPKPILEVVSV
jgi:hypothetical protein